MRIRITQLIVSTLALAIVPVTASLAAVPTTGSPQLSSNGHHYEIVQHADISWDDAKMAAENLSYLGVVGHLATLTSQAENNFAESVRSPVLGTYSANNKAEAWVGGYQPAGTDWVWVTGEAPNPIPPSGMSPAPNYANWFDGEPNNLNVEDHMTLGRFPMGKWNDSRVGNNDIGGYIVEYDTVPPVANDDLDNAANSGETIQIDVLANDDLNGQDVTAIEITSPSANGGTAEVDACDPPATSAFCVFYTSAPVFGGEDSFGYTVFSGSLASMEATVTIQVDGSVSETPSGFNIPILGGQPASVPMLATGDLAQNSGQSSIDFGCKIRDPRVYEKTRRGVTRIKFRWWKHFDIGDAIDDPALASPECAELLPGPGPGKLKIPPGFGVYTDPAIADEDLTLDDFVFGLSRIETGVVWSGPIHFDVDATDVAGFSVDCKEPTGGVPNQPLTLGLSTFPAEYTAPWMRPVTIECDPRGVAKWSTWYYTPNAAHVSPNFFTSLVSVKARFWILRGLIFALGQDDAVEPTLLDAINTQVVAAHGALGFIPNAMQIQNSIDGLDTATITVLTPSADPGGPAPAYPGSGLFPNPKGELASHVMALRYALCSELQNVNNLANCQPIPAVNALLPPLP